MGDVSYMAGRVNVALAGMSEEDREHWNNRVHYIAMDANFLDGSIAEFIEEKDFMGSFINYNSNGGSMSSLSRYFDRTLTMFAQGALYPVFLSFV